MTPAAKETAMTKLFTPSSTDLLRMIAAAESKFDAARAEHTEQAALKREHQENERTAKAWDAAVRARHYFRIQHG